MTDPSPPNIQPDISGTKSIVTWQPQSPDNIALNITNMVLGTYIEAKLKCFG